MKSKVVSILGAGLSQVPEMVMSRANLAFLPGLSEVHCHSTCEIQGIQRWNRARFHHHASIQEIARGIDEGFSRRLLSLFRSLFGIIIEEVGPENKHLENWTNSNEKKEKIMF